MKVKNVRIEPWSYEVGLNLDLKLNLISLKKLLEALPPEMSETILKAMQVPSIDELQTRMDKWNA